MKSLRLALPLLCLGCAAPAEPATEIAPTTVEVVAAEPINAICPRSGHPVSEDSLTAYRSYVVGFCNTHCRDDFAAHVDERPADRRFFDDAIAELE